MRILQIIAAAALGTFAVPAWAEDAVKSSGNSDETVCAAIITAVRSIGMAPQHRSVLVATWPTRRRPAEREQVVIGDVMYAKSSDRWMKLPIKASDRDQLSAALVRYPPHHCEVADPVESKSQKVYAYRQDVTGQDSATSRLWVDKQDGLPRRIESQEGTVRVVITLEYNNVEPPNIH